MIAGSSIGWGERMSGRSRDGVLLKVVGPLFGTAVGSLLGWLPSGLGSAIGLAAYRPSVAGREAAAR